MDRWETYKNSILEEFGAEQRSDQIILKDKNGKECAFPVDNSSHEAFEKSAQDFGYHYYRHYMDTSPDLFLSADALGAELSQITVSLEQRDYEYEMARIIEEKRKRY